MPSSVVSFRMDDDKLAQLKQQGLNVNDFAREAFERMLRRWHAEQIVNDPVRLRLPNDEPVEDVIRRMRDSR